MNEPDVNVGKFSDIISVIKNPLGIMSLIILSTMTIMICVLYAPNASSDATIRHTLAIAMISIMGFIGLSVVFITIVKPAHWYKNITDKMKQHEIVQKRLAEMQLELDEHQQLLSGDVLKDYVNDMIADYLADQKLVKSPKEIKPDEKVLASLTDEDIKKAIERVFEQSRGNWRSIRGVSEAAKLPLNKVEEYIADNPEQFEKPNLSGLPTGSEAFTLKKIKRENREDLSAFFK